MKVFFIALAILIACSWLLYGVSPFAILSIAPIVWLLIGAPVMVVTAMKRVVAPKYRILFWGAAFCYLAQLVVFGLSFTADGMYNFSGHGSSDPSAMSWLYSILGIGLISLFMYAVALYCSTRGTALVSTVNCDKSN